MDFAQGLWPLWGLARSLLIYYARPGRARRDRQFYGQWIRPGALCFDVGAHVGNRARVFLGLGARCVAVEPQPLFAGLLARLYGRHPHFRLEQAALGPAAGTGELHISQRTPTVSTTALGWQERVGQAASFGRVTWDQTIATRVLTLDGLIARYGRPDFCKIDVEGSELAVLQGLSQPLPLLSLEYIPAVAADAAACVQRLERLGRYRFNWSQGESQALRQSRWLTGEALCARLERLPRDGPSGDFYARLEQA